jgi:lysophospholipase L1-like esterase
MDLSPRPPGERSPNKVNAPRVRPLGFLVPIIITLVACQANSEVLLTAKSAPSPTSGPIRDSQAPPLVASGDSLPSSVPARPRGSWLAFGDSITQDAFRNPALAWNSAWPQPVPPVIDAAIRGIDSAYALTRVDETLTANPGVTIVGLAFGTNDAFNQRTNIAFHESLTGLVRRVKAFGKQAIICRIPYNTYPGYEGVVALNQVVDQVTIEQNLPAGPDLYAWFAAHPNELGPDHLHMTEAGNADIQRLWTKSALEAGF